MNELDTERLVQYGTFQHTITLQGKSYRADRIVQSRAERAELLEVYAIDGLPEEFAEPLIRAAQVCDVPHTWCVKPCERESEVSDETIAVGREVLELDQERYNAHIFTYVGKEPGGNLVFLAAGAVRNKLTPNFLDDRFPVVSRAVVAPRFRGKGVGTLIVEHRMLSALRYFSTPPCAIHFATESKPIFSAIKHVENHLGAPFVFIGIEQYETKAGLKEVMDFLCYLPSYQKLIEDSCIKLEVAFPAELATITDKFLTFMTKGVTEVRGQDLDVFVKKAENLLANERKNDLSNDLMKATAHLRELLLVRTTIGARDPQ